MVTERRSPKTFGILTAFFIVLIFGQLGCEKGTLGLRGGSISGSVVDSRTLAGLSDVSITATSSGSEEGRVSRFVTSDSNGNFHISGLNSGEWNLSFDKFGYAPLTGDMAVSLIVENGKTIEPPQVRMQRTVENQYITIRGTLKDAVNGSTITYGNAQFIFGQESFSNRLPTEFHTGFKIPAFVEPIEVSIAVEGYGTVTTIIESGQTDRNLGVIELQPESYDIVGRWHDVPGWVFEANPRADIFAYSGNRLIATTDAQLNSQQFEITGIPRGTSVSIEVELRGYRMNGPIVVHPPADFQGKVYQNFSLKNNFAQIMRDVKLIISGSGISANDTIGAFCEETGTEWPSTIVSATGFFGGGTPRVVDLGTNSIPSGYRFTFTGYVVDSGNTSSKDVLVSDDGASPQIVTIQVN